MQIMQMNVAVPRKNEQGQIVNSVIAVLYNTEVISKDEIFELLNTGRIFVDERVVLTSPGAATALLLGTYPPIQGAVC